MKLSLHVLLKALCLCLFTVLPLVASAQNRGLWVESARVTELRSAVQATGSHHQRVFAQMKAYVDAEAVNIITVPSRLGSNWNYDRSYLAQQAALTALLSSSSADQQYYANIAYDALYAVYADPDSGGASVVGGKPAPVKSDSGDGVCARL